MIYRINIQGWTYQKALNEYTALLGNYKAAQTMIKSLDTTKEKSE